MPPEKQVLRRISWAEVFPWLLLVRAFPLAIGPSILILGTLAVAAIPLGWQVAGALFLTETDRETPEVNRLASHWERLPGRSPQAASVDSPVGAPDRSELAYQAPLPATPADLWALVALKSDRMFRTFANTARRFVRQGLTARQLAYIAFGCLWTLLVAAIFGGMISRKAVVRLGREEAVGLGAAFGHVRRHLGAYVLAPLYPLFVVGVVVFGSALLGLLMRSDLGMAFAGLLWIFALLGALAAGVLLFGLLLGWPLMWGATSGEQEGDPFEALSRAYSYVQGRPLNLLFYAVVAALLGAAGWLLVANICELTVWIASRGADLGAAGRLGQLIVDPSEAGFMGRFGLGIVLFLNAAVRAAVPGFEFAYFWAAAAGVYLLMRSDVDHTEFDEVYLEETGERFSLPALELDAAGVPQVVPETADPDPPAAPDTA